MTFYNKLMVKILGYDSRAVEAMMSFNALISGIAYFLGDASGLATSAPGSHMITGWAILTFGHLLLFSFFIQVAGCLVLLFDEKKSLTCRMIASMIRCFVWCVMVLLLITGVSALTRLEARYSLFFVFEAWILMSLNFRRG